MFFLVKKDMMTNLLYYQYLSFFFVLKKKRYDIKFYFKDAEVSFFFKINSNFKYNTEQVE